MGLVATYVGCGDDRNDYTPLDPPGNTPSAGKSSKSDGGEGGESTSSTGGKMSTGGKGTPVTPIGGNGAGGDGEGPDLGTPPLVAVLSPDEVTDPNGGAVLVADNIDVKCKVSDGQDADATEAVDPKSVKVSLVDADGNLVGLEKDAVAQVTPNEYLGTLPLTSAPTGVVGLRCSAKTLKGAIGEATVSSLVDRGPKITITAPVKDTRVALKEPLTVTFKVEPQALSPDDAQEDVASTELKINGVPLTATPLGDGEYSATVDLNGAQFEPKPNDATALAVSAKNKRKPMSASGIATTNVFVDGAGPDVKITGPVASQVVGGMVKVTFSASDLISGVNEDKVVITYGGTKKQYNKSDPSWTHNDPSFSYTFDSRDFASDIVQISVSVTAEDKVGNLGTSPSIPLYFDNVAPQVDLDPQAVRTKNGSQCSGPFDPLGSAAVNDKQAMDKSSNGNALVRALVWERTNLANTPGILPVFSGLNPATVRVYFRNASGTPLLINSKAPGQGTCNEIDSAAESIDLKAVTQDGTPFYNLDGGSPVLPNTCSTSGGTQPPLLCGGDSDMWQVIGHHEADLNENAVFARLPQAGAQCTGQGWNFQLLVDQDGWACFAARAEDKAGNVGVSPPLRLCVDLPGGTTPACATDPQSVPPTCTDGCAPPARGGNFVTDLN
jgi:hypothetical protein